MQFTPVHEPIAFPKRVTAKTAEGIGSSVSMSIAWKRRNACGARSVTLTELFSFGNGTAAAEPSAAPFEALTITLDAAPLPRRKFSKTTKFAEDDAVRSATR